MGRDISPIGNHNLNTEDVEKLAEDLVSRLDMNIEYGYYQDEDLSVFLGGEKESKFVTMGKIIKHKNFETFRLIDEVFQLKMLYDKYGYEFLYNADYWKSIGYENIPEERWIIERKKEIEFPRYCLEFDNEKTFKYININKENYQNQIPYYSRWWTFCRFFIEKSYKDKELLKYFNKFRKELMNYALKMGGGKIYYLDDQDEELQGVGQGEETYMTWVDFENFVYDKTSHLMLDIPKFMTDKDYREAFLRLNEYPLSFIDNFEDIRD